MGPMIRLEEDRAGRYLVIGSLRGDLAVNLLARVLARGAVVLDLSQVDQVDDTVVQLLAAIPPERVTFEGAPTWLSLWIDRVRRSNGPASR